MLQGCEEPTKQIPLTDYQQALSLLREMMEWEQEPHNFQQLLEISKLIED